MAEENNPENQSPAQLFTSADRIRQLNDIDQDVAKLIYSAGLAVQALTNARSNDPSSSSSTTFSSNNPNNSTSTNTLETHKTRFKEATSQYFALLSSIDVRLRRQVYALEEASILAPDSAGARTEGSFASAAAAAGASNPLDVSWLNSRKDTVGKEKEAELWRAAREFVQTKRGDGGGVGEGGKDKDAKAEGMEVD
ncbi:mediator of RNA polymerase II transcription subunit 11 [Aspergillus undulatus]|uniref:mediator of RNA polymerase II transcription subunit 11 n=1 Tax=Aspergillus undulatus TaxID=1810928 RepID=UPI003CCDCF94